MTTTTTILLPRLVLLGQVAVVSSLVWLLISGQGLVLVTECSAFGLSSLSFPLSSSPQRRTRFVRACWDNNSWRPRRPDFGTVDSAVHRRTSRSFAAVVTAAARRRPIVRTTTTTTTRLFESNGLDNDDVRGKKEKGDNDGEEEEEQHKEEDGGVGGVAGGGGDQKKGGFDVESARSQLETLISKEEEEDGCDSDSDSDNKLENRRTAMSNLTQPPFSVAALLSSISIEALTTTPVWDDNNNKINSNTSLAVPFVITLPPPPPMSTMDRNRKELEITLLELLKEGDTFLGELRELWDSERGPGNQNIMALTGAAVSDPRLWVASEEILVGLIENRSVGKMDMSNSHGVYFVEAVNRLATLYFLQGRLDDSYKLCRVVLHLKPWHVGALSGIVQVCIGRGEKDEARMWAQRRLPNVAPGNGGGGSSSSSLPESPRRVEWCDKAVADAKDLLRKAEQSTVDRLGRPEDYYSRSRRGTPPTKQQQNETIESDNDQLTIGIDGDDAWQ